MIRHRDTKADTKTDTKPDTKSDIGNYNAPDNKSALDLDVVFHQNDISQAERTQQEPPPQDSRKRETQHYARTRRHTTRYRPQPRPEYQAFAEKLNALMRERDLSPSEVARRTWGSNTDSRGYSVARNRDRIGHYLAGTSYPGEINLKKLADVLGVPVETLAIERPPSGAPQTQLSPARVEPGASRTALAPGVVHITLSPGLLGLARFQCDRMISPELAIEFQHMLAEDEKKQAGGSVDKNNGNGDPPHKAHKVGSIVGGRGGGD